jgi:adenine-specific DNA-methyltransferase
VPKVSVLYLPATTVGLHLELLRNICEPDSRSRPHVTVRYFEKLAVPPHHLSATVRYIDLVAPDQFGFDNPSQRNRTVFIRCESDDLLPLEHKPNFPTSEFHITVYDGASENFARMLLRLLREFRWGIRLILPKETSLTEIEISSGRVPRRLPSSRIYPEEIQELFHLIVGRRLVWEEIRQLDVAERLLLAQRICAHLDGGLPESSRIPARFSGRDRPVRQSNGSNTEVHLTPPELARDIAHCALTYFDASQGILFGDPAVGTGAFFAALLQEASKQQIVSAIGIDINPDQVRAAQWRWQDKGMEVLQGDYLHMDQIPQRNLILANPPYLRHQGIPAAYKAELRQRASAKMNTRISGLSGQYVYFLLLADEWMASGAVAAWLIPSEFMRTSYGQAVREYLSERVQLLRIHQFGHEDPQFENAEVLPCVVIFRKAPADSRQVIALTSGGTLKNPARTQHIEVQQLKKELKWSIPFRLDRQLGGARLGDLFEVRRGIATGANEFFVLERTRAREYGLPDEALRPLLPKIKNLPVDIVERGDDGFPLVSPQLCLLDCALPREVIRQQYPMLDAYLMIGEASGLLEANLVGRRKPWYRQEWRPVPRFLCTYMGRPSSGRPTIRFILNRSDAVALNTYLLLYPLPALEQFLQRNPDHDELLFAALRRTAEISFENVGRVHAGGLQKIEPSELLEVRLHDLPADLARLTAPQLFEENYGTNDG